MSACQAPFGGIAHAGGINCSAEGWNSASTPTKVRRSRWWS